MRLFLSAELLCRQLIVLVSGMRSKVPHLHWSIQLAVLGLQPRQLPLRLKLQQHHMSKRILRRPRHQTVQAVRESLPELQRIRIELHQLPIRLLSAGNTVQKPVLSRLLLGCRLRLSRVCKPVLELQWHPGPLYILHQWTIPLSQHVR